MLDKFEKKMVKLAIFHIIFGGVPQFIICMKFFANAEFLDNMSIQPELFLVIFILPSLIWKRLTSRIAFKGMDKEDLEMYREHWSESEPSLFFYLPMLQMHSGFFYLYKITIVAIVRLIKRDKTWRETQIYLFVKPDS